jgi:hypothetical protein
MFRVLLALAMGLFAAATAPLAPTPAQAQSHVVGITTAQVDLSTDTGPALLGHIYITERDGELVRALMIHQRRDGLPPLRVAEARATGGSLPFSASTASDGCMQAYCRDVYLGTIYVTEQMFARAQRQGLTARLIGPNTTVRIRAPGALFVQAAQRAGHVLNARTGI